MEVKMEAQKQKEIQRIRAMQLSKRPPSEDVPQRRRKPPPGLAETPLKPAAYLTGLEPNLSFHMQREERRLKRPLTAAGAFVGGATATSVKDATAAAGPAASAAASASSAQAHPNAPIRSVVAHVAWSPRRGVHWTSTTATLNASGIFTSPQHMRPSASAPILRGASAHVSRTVKQQQQQQQQQRRGASAHVSRSRSSSQLTRSTRGHARASRASKDDYADSESDSSGEDESTFLTSRLEHVYIQRRPPSAPAVPKLRTSLTPLAAALAATAPPRQPIVPRIPGRGDPETAGFYATLDDSSASLKQQGPVWWKMAERCAAARELEAPASCVAHAQTSPLSHASVYHALITRSLTLCRLAGWPRQPTPSTRYTASPPARPSGSPR